MPWESVLYALIFTFICVINQRIQTASVSDGWRESFRDMTGFPIAALILLHYKKEEFRECRVWHGLWSIGGAAFCVLFFLMQRSRVLFVNDLFVVTAEIFIWGFVLIQTIYSIAGKKKVPHLQKGIFILWAVMLLFMIGSRSDETWPLSYTVMFLCFYLTDFTKQDKEQILQGILNGLILSFFIFQAHCFLYRPYDQARYRGWFSNSNVNVLFYCFVLMAVLVKLYLCRKKNAGKGWYIYYWLGIGTVLSFIIMTIGRMGWILAAVLVVLFLVFQKREFGKSILGYGALALLVTAVTFPCCFGAARYIPPIRHHVVWFYGEYEENKVHSWDSWDSEKFIDIDEFAEAAWGRIGKSIEDLWNNLPWVLNAEAAGLAHPEIPVLDNEQGKDGYKVRSTIYKTFMKTLNFRGYLSTEIGFQLTEYFWVYHAHNIYLQFGIQFGIPVLLLFAMMILISLKNCWNGFRQNRSAEMLCSFYLILIPALFGLFEYTWGAGHMAITLLFMAWRQVLVKEDENMH